MADLSGIVRTAKEALLCKSSSSLLCQNHESAYSEVAKIRRQNPLLNRMYHSRNSIIHRMVTSCMETFFIKSNVLHNQGRKFQILLLGAGIDISYDKLYSDSAIIFAVDFPEIITERIALLSDLKACDMIRPDKIIDSCQSVSISGDLCYFEDIWGKLLVNGFDKEQLTIVVIECVLCYIDTSSVLKLLQQLSSCLDKKSVLIIYDPIVPKSSSIQSSSQQNSIFKNNEFAQMMADKFDERKAPILHCVESKEMQKKLVQSCNWTYVRTCNMYEALQNYLTNEKRKVPISLEPFDEFSSLALIHKLYGVTFASRDEKLFDLCLADMMSSGKVGHGLVSTQSPLNGQVDSVNSSDKCDAKAIKKHGADASLTLLMKRISIAENRLQALIERDFCTAVVSSCGFRFRIREAKNTDSDAVVNLFTESFSTLSAKFPAVRKFVKKSVKGLKTLETEYSKVDGNNFWVIETDDGGDENTDTGAERVVVGCIGIKTAKPTVVYSKKSSDTLKSDSVQNVESHHHNESNSSIMNGDIPENEESRGEVSHMCVSHGQRRMGLARALLAHLINWAIQPDTVDTGNPLRIMGHEEPSTIPETNSTVELADLNTTTDENSDGTVKINKKSKSVSILPKRFSSLDLTVLTELLAARSLYLDSGFMNEGSMADLGGNCYLQHMAMRL